MREKGELYSDLLKTCLDLFILDVIDDHIAWYGGGIKRYLNNFEPLGDLVYKRLGSLERKGMIENYPTPHGRIKAYKLTDKGKRYMMERNEELEMFIKDCKSHLSPIFDKDI